MDNGTQRNILIVEDDEALNRGIAFALSREGYRTSSAYSLKEAASKLKQRVDLVLLDINLPDGDGREFLKGTLAAQPVPVLLLTARDTEEDMLEGFLSGCDDYITKPFSIPVLTMKIKAVLKMSSQASTRVYISGNLTYDFDKKQLSVQEKQIELTALELRLIEIFILNPNIVLPRERLLEKIWDVNEKYVEDGTLNVTIRRLREKIEENPSKPQYIKTVFGIGYKWKDEGRPGL